MKNIAKFAGLGVALAGLTAGGVAMGGGDAGATSIASTSVYKSAEAISQDFGSKRAAGFFLRQDGACAMTMFLTEDGDGSVAPSATRVKFTLKPGAKAEFSSVEAQTMELSCAADASLVEVRKGAVSTQ